MTQLYVCVRDTCVSLCALVMQPGHFCQGHAPVIDGPGNFLPSNPLEQRENGEFSRVPLMGGYNAEDGSVYVIACEYTCIAVW